MFNSYGGRAPYAYLHGTCASSPHMEQTGYTVGTEPD